MLPGPVEEVYRTVAIHLLRRQNVAKGNSEGTHNAVVNLAIDRVVPTRQEIITHHRVVDHSLKYDTQVACLAHVVDTPRRTSLARERVGVWQHELVFLAGGIDGVELSLL